MRGLGFRAYGLGFRVRIKVSGLGIRLERRAHGGVDFETQRPPPNPKPYLKSQVAQNNRLPYPKVALSWLKVAPKYRLLAFQVPQPFLVSKTPTREFLCPRISPRNGQMYSGWYSAGASENKTPLNPKPQTLNPKPQRP